MGLDPPVGGLHEVLAGGGASFEVALIVRSRARVLAKVTLEASSGVTFTMVLSLELETKAMRRFAKISQLQRRAFSWLKASTSAFTFMTLL